MAEELIALALYTLLKKPDPPSFSGIVKEGGRPLFWEMQPLTQAYVINPTQNTYYPMMDEHAPLIRVYRITALAKDTGETLQVSGWIDNPNAELVGVATACVADTSMYARLEVPGSLATGPRLHLQATEPEQAFLFEGRAIELKIQKTTNNGNDDIFLSILWSKMV